MTDFDLYNILLLPLFKSCEIDSYFNLHAMAGLRSFFPGSLVMPHNYLTQITKDPGKKGSAFIIIYFFGLKAHCMYFNYCFCSIDLTLKRLNQPTSVVYYL